MNATTTYIYIVHSDINENNIYAEFTDEQAAIEYARKNAAELTYVDKVEVLLDDDGEVEEEFGSETIWVYSEEETATESEEDYWDDLATMYDEEEANKHDLGDTTWFESVNTAELVETLEENEDEVECKECFDLFPKADCIKVDFGYICPTCAEGGTVSEDEIFKIDFPEYEKFSDGNAMVPEEPTIPVESGDETPIQDPQEETIPISTPEEAVPYLVTDERDAVAGYEKAAEIVADSDLDNKDEILEVIDHIKEEKEEHIEELTDLIDTKEAEVPEDETDPVSEDEVEEIEDPEATEPTTLVEDAGIKTWTCWYEGNDIGTVEAATEEEAAELMMSTYPEYQYNNTDWSVELTEDVDADIEDAKKALKLAKINTKIEKQRTKASKQVAKQAKADLSATKSTNKATKDTSSTNVTVSGDDVKVAKNELKKAKVDAKRQEIEDETPDETSEEVTLTESKRDPFHEAIFEAIDYLTEFSDIFPVPENIGAANWEELKDDINYGLSSDFEIAEIIMEYFQKDLAIGEKHPEIFEDDPQSELTLETYNRLKQAYDRAVTEYEAKYPEDFEEQLDLTHGYDHIKSVTSIVHTAVEKLTKDNRVGTRPDGMSFYVLSDKSSADPEEMRKLILDTLAENGYEPDEVQFVDKGQVYGFVISKIKATARMTMSYQKRESLLEEVEDDILATNSRGDYLVKNSSGRGYSVFNRSNVWQGGFECDDDDFAVKRFKCGDIQDKDLDESAILAAAASGIIVDVVKRIFDKFGEGKKKSKWYDFRKYVIEKTPEGQVNIWDIDGEQVASDLKTIKAAKEKIKTLPKPKKDKVTDSAEKDTNTEVKESLTEDTDEGEEFNPTSEDPAEKPSKNVKMANTAGTAGMDFEAACKTFGINLEN